MSGQRELVMPNHVAIILDGNGRWAKRKGMPRNYGHVQGAKNVEVICEEAYKMGIQYLTVYAFSTENWNRPKDEVDALMKLLRNYMKTCLATAKKNRMWNSLRSLQHRRRRALYRYCRRRAGCSDYLPCYREERRLSDCRYGKPQACIRSK